MPSPFKKSSPTSPASTGPAAAPPAPGIQDRLLAQVESAARTSVRQAKSAGEHQSLAPEDAQDLALRMGLDLTDPRDRVRLLQQLKRAAITAAQHDPARFCSYVLRDEQTDKPIMLAPMHEEWHDLLNQHDRLVIWSHIEGGKTSQIAIGRTLFELGKNPNLRVAIISNTNELAQKIVRQLGQYIQKSVELHEVFPSLIPNPDPSLPWKSRALTILRPATSKDASLQACGMHGNIIGARLDLIILDDVLDPENTDTPVPRADAYKWLKFITGRLSQNGRIWAITNAWHPDDAMHRFERDGYVGKRFPVLKEDGTPRWPQVWPLKRIERARGPGGIGPLEFARQLMCQARDDTSARFKREWIDLCIDRGRGVPFIENIEQLVAEDHGNDEELEEFKELQAVSEAIWRLSGKLEGCGIITGVDLAVQKSDTADSTVLFTICVYPNGDRRVLNIRSGKWTGPEIIREIKRCHQDFGGMFVVENNAAQAYIVQFIQADTAIPIVPFRTGRNKADPSFGVESVATELANGKWIIPSSYDAQGKPIMHKEILDWISELLFFDPREHTGDRVMAGWFAREGARKFVDLNNEGDGEVSAHIFKPRQR